IEVRGFAVRLRADDYIHPTAAGATSKQAGRYRFAAWHVTREERFAITHGTAIDLGNRRGLRRGKAIGAISPCLADGNIASRIEIALARIIDQTILKTVDRITFCHYFVGDQFHFGRRDRRFAERFLIPHRANGETRLIDPWRVGDDAIEIL